MVIELHTLIYRVRENLSDLPYDMIDDEQIFFSLKSSQEYVDSVKYDDVEEGAESNAIIWFATYLTYLNYISLTSRNFGEVPPDTFLKQGSLKEIALSYIRNVSKVPIDDNLSVNSTWLNKVAPGAVGLMQNVWSS